MSAWMTILGQLSFMRAPGQGLEPRLLASDRIGGPSTGEIASVATEKASFRQSEIGIAPIVFPTIGVIAVLAVTLARCRTFVQR